MRLREIFTEQDRINNPYPQPVDFGMDNSKRLDALPFYYKALNDTLEWAQDPKRNTPSDQRGQGFIKQFERNLAIAYKQYMAKGGIINASQMNQLGLFKTLISEMPLAINRYELPKVIADKLEQMMSDDSSLIDQLLKVVDMEVIIDPRSNRAVLYRKGDDKSGMQKQLFVGDPGRTPRGRPMGQNPQPKQNTFKQTELPGMPQHQSESNDWDNPSNAELDAEREEAERISDIMMADRETAKMLTNKSPQAIQLANKIRQATLLKFAKRHGDQKAGTMIYNLEQRDPAYFIKKANMDLMGIQ